MAFTSAEIRSKFLQFFESKGHTTVPSASLVPSNDPTLLFTNAGMVPFKDVFLGRETRPYSRAASSQRCVRAGGKHNDLDIVGYTAMHHSFFDLLGNFIFGDYFKREAIQYAWELLTTSFGLPAERLWVTVYEADDEAYNIWKDEVGVPAERIVRIGDNHGAPYASDNFWQMADTGPCGPCSEIFYDHGPDVWGGPPGSPDEDGDRYIEIWNLVFMQYDRDANGKLNPLPKPCVDTGMGLERIAAVLQKVHSNYEIDIFQNLIRAAAREVAANGGQTPDLTDNSLKVIADHIRACAFLIVDGVIPGNEGRGYVLRRIIRRALRHGYKLGQTQPFFHRLVPDLVAEMGQAFPELAEASERVSRVLRQEEERFGETLEHGMRILDGALAKLEASQTRMLDGDTAFTLYDTYGFPLDLTADICRERNVEVDVAAFDRAMQQQRDQARAAGKFKMAAGLSYEGDTTDFRGYDSLVEEARVVALYADGTAVKQLEAGTADAVVVLDRTPFYAEAGGQHGDSGELTTPAGARFAVLDTQKVQADVFGHHGTLQTGVLTVGDAVRAQVDAVRRQHTIRNHSATHLLHKALREVLGSHVQQKGSLVDDEKTRFDFAHDAPLTQEQIEAVEAIVNREVLANTPVGTQMMSYDDAVQGGAVALFGEKYGDQVRVLDIGFSRELCGGTHVQRTGDIGLFKIVSEGGVAAGVRRLEAITGEHALRWVQNTANQLHEAASLLRTQPAELAPRIQQLQAEVKALEKELAQARDKLTASAGADLASQAVKHGDVAVLVTSLEGVDAKAMRGMLDQLKDKLGRAVILLATSANGKVNLAAGVTKDLTGTVKAGELVNVAAQKVGGKGGGRPDMAMAGGSDPAGLPAALDAAREWIAAQL